MKVLDLTEPFKILKGRSVSLHPFQSSDINDDYVSWLNDQKVTKYSNQRFITHTTESCKRYFNTFCDTPNLFISVRRLKDNLRVGTMTAYVSNEHQTADLGIMIGRKTVWGDGLGQDAWDTLIDWFLEKTEVRKITAGTMRCNSAMIKLMERSGMNLECVRPKQELLNGTPQDICYFSKYRLH